MTNELPSVDALIALAKKDPAALERLRQQQVEELIASAPEDMQRRLRGLQFEIDSRRALHKNPMGACVALSKMMLDSMTRLNEALHGMNAPDAPATQPSAAVIPFSRAVNH